VPRDYTDTPYLFDNDKTIEKLQKDIFKKWTVYQHKKTYWDEKALCRTTVLIKHVPKKKPQTYYQYILMNPNDKNRCRPVVRALHFLKRDKNGTYHSEFLPAVVGYVAYNVTGKVVQM
jgi:hypothetical protein